MIVFGRIRPAIVVTLLICVYVTQIFAVNPAKIDEIIKAAYGRGEFSGVVVISENGKTTYNRAFGLANREFNVANQLSTKFRICSVTKQFTAVLMMQLVEEGKIELDKYLSDYLPKFRKETGSKIKIRDLLLSASGLPILPDEFYISEDAKMTDAQFVIGKYLQGDLTFVPGERFNYNNGDFILLGAIIAKISGKTYEAVLKEKILSPLGMKNTGLLKNEDIVTNLASGYGYRNGAYFNEGFVQIQNFGAAGAMYSNGEDLLTWNKALLENKILSKKTRDEMFTPSPKLGFVGLGSWSYNLKFANGKTSRIVERQGYINGFCALNILIPDENIAAVFLSNIETQTLFQTYTTKGLSYDVLNAAVVK